MRLAGHDSDDGQEARDDESQNDNSVSNDAEAAASHLTQKDCSSINHI